MMATEMASKTVSKAAKAGRCKWTEDEDGVWDTGCDNRFEFNADGGPLDHGFVYCPYCGLVVSQFWYKEKRPRPRFR